MVLDLFVLLSGPLLVGAVVGAWVSTGRLFLRNVGMVFDAYLDANTARRPVYSRTV